MYERIVEIIMYVMSELKVNNDIQKVNLDVLINHGYTNSEISTALSWIVDRMDFSEKIIPFSSNTGQDSFRILQEAEKELFTADAWGELIALQSIGIINNDNIEALIDRTVMLGLSKIDTKQLKIFVADFIYNLQFNNIAGSRFMLQGNDTVN